MNRTSLLAALFAGLLLGPAAALAQTCTPGSPENDCDLDGCTVRQGDCADDPTTNPYAAQIRGPGCPNNAAPEVCDGQDNNCSGGIDEGNPGGGVSCSTGQPGVCAPGTTQCLSGSVQCVRNVNPSTEVCDGKDNDCDGSTDESATVPTEKLVQSCYTGPGGTVGVGICHAGQQACNAAAGSGTASWTACGSCAGLATCTAEVVPGTETCNSLDDDCDGTPDDGNPGGGAACSTGQQGVCGPGTLTCTGGSLQCVRTVNPSTEVCDGKDNDCDGSTDESATVPAEKLVRSCYTGPGGTAGVGICRSGQQACNAAAGSGTASWTACGVCGSLATCTTEVLPGTETCNSLDDDCDGTPDDGNPGGGAACSTGQQGVCGPGTMTCTGGSLQCVRTVNPTAEVCDGRDNDCDGVTDEQNAAPSQKLVRSCYTGPTGTAGVGICRSGQQACDAAAGSGAASWTACGVCGSLATCSTEVLPGTESCNSLDDDCDGTVDDGFIVDADGDGVRACGTCGAPAAPNCDCNDAVAAIKPGATELCDNIDNDCDGFIDENLTRYCYTGPSGTYTGTCPGTNCNPRGTCQRGSQTCSAGTWDNLSCTGQVLPGTEVCDGLDNDCDGTADDGLGGASCNTGQPGVCGPGTEQCLSGGLQCVRTVNPSTEVCDNLDNDCNGQVDDNVAPRRCFTGPAGTYTGTCPGASCTPRGQCRAGTQTCDGAGAWNVCTNETLPATEVCNSLDDDCDGTVDDGLITDADTDGVRACGTCGAPAAPNCDCDDANNQVRPGRSETCNAIDDNCNGSVDEGTGPGGKLSRNCYSGPAGTVGVGTCVAGVQPCNATVPGTASWGTCTGEVVPTNPPADPESTCNARDDDCDGTVDDGFDVDRDGFVSCLACGSPTNCDCNDNDPTIKPGAVELCDAVDQNCNGRLDDVPPRKCFADATGSIPPPVTYSGTCPGPTCSPNGTCVAGTQTCSVTGSWGLCVGAVMPANDPALPETTCDGRDDDCDGTVDDNASFDQDGDTFKACSVCSTVPRCDCNDAAASIHPGALEVCDGVDNDCDGTIDGTSTSCYSGPAGTAGVGECRAGTATCLNGQPSGPCGGEALPVPESCDNKDNDCDGQTDEDFDQDHDGVSTCAGDCDDADPFNRPGGVEVCDCHDNNCDSIVDNNNVCYAAPCHDFDFDGFTNCQGDCDDSSAAIGPQRSEVVGNSRDDDCDGRVDEDTDEDGDGYSTGQGDCDDHFTAIHPGAVEVCDGFDNNCDGQVDEGFDQDGDFATTCAGDCDDTDPNRSPFRREICGNGADDNCDGRIDEDTDVDGDGVTTCQGDCNDFNASVHPAFGAVPAAAEICDGQDNDCNGRFDEGFDEDADFVATCFGDCDDTDPNVGPHRYEIPGNSKDDNCNGEVDEGNLDRDGDGFTPMCGDCNDSDPTINPHATEICDRIDNNCDAYVDSELGRYDLCAVCFDSDNDGQTNCDGDCNDNDDAVYRGAPELCDLKDNDCDGDTDLDPVTGLRVCRADGGVEDGGVEDGGTDAGEPDAGAEPDAGVEPPVTRPVVATGCGCGSTDVAPTALLGLLGALWLARRRRRAGGSRAAPVASATLLSLVVLLATGCPSVLTFPGPGDGGDGDAGEVDGGTDGGFRPPVEDWPCPELFPVEHLKATVPGTLNLFAYSRRYTLTTNDTAQLLLLDDAPADVAAFVVRRPVPSGVDPTQPNALETVAAREIVALDLLQGSPAVRDRTERFNRVYEDERKARNLSVGQTLVLASPTSAFAVRNRLVSTLSGHGPADLGTLPVPASATVETTHIVYLLFRLTQSDFFIAGAVAPDSRFRASQPALSDLTNGSHLSGQNASLEYKCEHRVTPPLRTDFIFVVDDSGSMLEEQSALVTAADSLFGAFQRSGLDFRVGVVTTDSDVLRGQGFTSDLDQFKADVRVGINGNGHEMGVEYGLRAIRRAKQETDPALKLREGAGLVVVFLSDEDNAGLKPVMGTGGYADDYVAEGAVVFAIVGPRPVGCTRVGLGRALPGTDYIDLATATGGSSGSICNPNLTEVIEEVVVGALGASSKSPLARRPISGSLAVRTDHEVPRARSNGFDYDPSTNTVLFFGAVPAVGSPFQVAYALFEYIE